MSTSPPRAAVYLRLSRKPRTGDESRSIEFDRQDCRKLADTRGWNVVAEYVDDGVSAYTKGRVRAGFRDLLEAVEAGEVDVIVAKHPDRFYRAQRDLVEFIDVVEKAGVDVETVAGGVIDLTTASGRMSARVVGAVNQHESERISERCRVVHDHLAEQGRWSGGPRPYGYQPGLDGTLDIDHDEAAIVAEAANRVLGGESLYSIVKDLQGRKIPTAQGAQWKTATLRRILTAPTSFARREHHGEDVGPAIWQPILDPEIRGELEQSLTRAARKPPARVSLLAGGFGRCGRCHAALITGRRANGARVLVCPSSVEREGCGKLSIVAEPAERLVAAAVIARLAGTGLAREIAATRTDPDLAAQVERDERMLVEIAEDYANGGLTRAERDASRSVVVERLEQNRAAMIGDDRARVLRGLPTSEAELADAWEHRFTLDRQRAILGAVVDRVVIAPGKPGRTFDESRVLDGIEWLD